MQIADVLTVDHFEDPIHYHSVRQDVTLMIAVLIFSRSWRDSFGGLCRTWNGDAKSTTQEES